MPSGGNMIASAPGARWVVANTLPNREQLALENLNRQEFNAYCPVIRKTTRHARQTKEALRPLFPGYLFINVDPRIQRWRPLLSTVGIRSVVRSGEELSFLDNEFIAALRAREVDGVIEKPSKPYEIGQDVEIIQGAFSGLIAKIVNLDERDRLVLLLSLFNQSVRLKVGHGMVRETKP